FGSDEDFEHCELLPGQRDVAAVAVDLSAERIQPQTCDLSHGWPGASAVERSETEHELSELERLREVVVGAELEPGGLVVETVGGGEHEDRHAAAGGDDAFRDLVAGGPGDVSVEDGDVVRVDAQQLESGVAALLVVIAAIPAALGYQLLASSSSTAASPTDVLRSDHRGALGEADGLVPDGVTVFDDQYPAIAKLDPAFLRALRRAATE